LPFTGKNLPCIRPAGTHTAGVPAIYVRGEAEGYQAQVRKELDALAARKNLSNAQLALLATWYKNVEQPEKANKYAAIVRQKDPKGPFVMMERFHVIYEGTDPAGKNAAHCLAKDFPAQPDLIRSAAESGAAVR
jgi:hypothetical protein